MRAPRWQRFPSDTCMWRHCFHFRFLTPKTQNIQSSSSCSSLPLSCVCFPFRSLFHFPPRKKVSPVIHWNVRPRESFFSGTMIFLCVDLPCASSEVVCFRLLVFLISHREGTLNFDVTMENTILMRCCQTLSTIFLSTTRCRFTFHHKFPSLGY